MFQEHQQVNNGEEMAENHTSLYVDTLSFLPSPPPPPPIVPTWLDFAGSLTPPLMR